MSTAIEFEDIRVGDRVRGIDYYDNGTTVTVECVVTDLDDNWFTDGGSFESFRVPKTTPGVRRSFELIERPKPEFKPGQVWSLTLHDTAEYLTINWWGNAKDIGWVNRHSLTQADSEFIQEHAGRLVYVGEAEITVKP